MTSRAVRVVVADLNGFAGTLVRRIVLNATANLTEDTPVDTGWARSNWVPRIGEPFSGTAGTRREAEEGRIDAGSQAQGLASVVGTYRLGPAVYITNNVPYIQKLNAGSSRKAPSMFVEAALLRAVRQVASNS